MTTPYQKKHQEIAQAAISVFLEKGFELTSMDAVAAKAGISKVTVYNHFQDKKELFEQVMVAHCASISQGKKLLTFSKDLPPGQILETYAHALVALLLHEKSVALMRVVIGEAGRFPELAEAIWPGGKLPMHEELADYFMAEHEAKRLHITNIPLAVRQFFGLLKENLVWPVLMGVKTDTTKKNIESVIKPSVALFLAYYQKS